MWAWWRCRTRNRSGTQGVQAETHHFCSFFVLVLPENYANCTDQRIVASSLNRHRRSHPERLSALDRLARNVHFVSGLIETGVDFIAADMPNANKVMIQMHAAMSEWERAQISERTKAALVAAKARGVVLGVTGSANLRRHIKERQEAARAFRERLRPVLDGFLNQGLSRRAIAEQLNALGIAAPRGGTWSLCQVQRLVR